MTKVRVQDATKELSTNAGRLLESVGKSKRQVQDILQTLRRASDDMYRQQREQAEQEKREALSRQYEEAASFMTAYSTEQVPQPTQSKPAEPVEVKATPAVEQPQEKPTEAPAAVAQAEPVGESSREPMRETAPAIAIEKPTVREIQPQPAQPSIQQPQFRPVQPRPAYQAQPGQQSFQQPQRPFGRPAQPAQGGPYGRPVAPQGAPQPQGAQSPQQGGGFYNRPAQPGQGGPYGRPVQPQGAQPPQQGGFYNRPAQPGQGGPYGRPVTPQGGAQAPYGRPAQPGMGGPYGRPVQGGAAPGAPRPYAPRPAGVGGPPRPPMGGARPGFGRKAGPELTPTVEKERVSNYDPNKKQYVRQNDPERAKNKKQIIKEAGPKPFGDDEFVRNKRRKKAQMNFRPELIRIEKAFMTADTITVKDLTERIGKPAGEIIKKLLLLGIMATINKELDFDTAQLVCNEFGVELEMKKAETAEDVLESKDFEDTEGDLEARPPVVTIMGHVDHGKTSLLDYIRKTRVTAGEAGGITQHIGAYTVDIRGQQITFLDTPGHEAFTAMRARGAQATDIAILVVAADDGVMPQTIEAINHAKAAKVPTIIAINKMDKAAADPERIKQDLTAYGLVAEEWGGDTIMVPVSAVTGENVDQLLEMILLVAEVQNYRANPNRKARGVIIEARLDKGRGPVATVLIKNGTLHVGDAIVAGTAFGRVRAMVNDRGERVKEALPSDPVEVIGFNDVPDAGDVMSAVEDDKLSRQVVDERKDKQRAALVKSKSQTTLDDLYNQISAGEVKDLNLIIKADVQGSVEAVRQSLEKLSNEEVRVRAIHGGVGAITESDIMLASASNAIIIGFNVRTDNAVRDIAEREKVDIRLYRIIYNAIEEIQSAMKGMLTPKFKEIILGRAQVRQVFRVTGVGMIAGSYVTEGKIIRNAQARLLRDNVIVQEAKVESLKRFKDDAKDVAAGYECGIGLENYNDIKEGDVIECFQMEEIER